MKSGRGDLAIWEKSGRCLSAMLGPRAAEKTGKELPLPADSRWYQTYFSEPYWRFAELQSSAEQTAAEVAYLREVLVAQAPGRRVVELGCGVGRHAIGLAQAGFAVTGLDQSAWAFEEARRRGARAGADVRWECVDLLAPDPWPLAEVDAAICVDSFGWGRDGDQRRLLRRLRRHLAPGGLLILVFSDALAAARRGVGPLEVADGGVSYRFQDRYDPLSGRDRGELTVAAPGQPAQVLSCDLRLYSAAELLALVRSAGFGAERLDADFAVSRPPGPETHRFQIVAAPIQSPPAALAVASWGSPAGSPLDLRYAPDEAALLRPSPDAIWQDLLGGEPRQGAGAVGHYPVDDPYGGERAATVVSGYFGCAIERSQLTFGPGVTSLLHDLAGLADGGLVLGPQLVHPDLTVWAAARGNEVYLVEGPATLERLADEIRGRRPALVHLDRPNFAGELLPLEDLYALGLAAAQVGAAVLVDESPATYFGPAGSAVPLVRRLDNLVVLRGLTKAYSWGGLRVGYACASRGVSERVRELVCPLQVGELALRAALRLLAAGDIFYELRGRIHTMKPRMVSLLRSCGFEVRLGHPDLPWAALADPGGEVSRRLASLGICGLRFAPSPALRGAPPEVLVLFSPLADERMDELRRRLEGEPADVGRGLRSQVA